MKKSKPVHDLERIKDLISKKNCRVTTTAQQFGHELGFSSTDIQDVVLGLDRKNFQHSMTENNDARAWQDVYRATCGNLDLYIKLKIGKADGALAIVVSFKKYGDGRMKP